MSILKDLREADFLTTFQSLPPTVQDKVCLIEELYDRAMLYLRAREKARAGVPEFDVFLRDLYKKAKVTQGDLESEPKVDTWGAYYLGLDIDDWIEILGDSRYRPGNLVHVAMMLFALWIYWMTWPNRRRIFEEEKKITLCNVLEPVAPPSSPSFEATLDRSLVWLALDVGIDTANIRHWGKKREARARQNLIKRGQEQAKRTWVFKIYSISSKVEVGMKRYAVAGVIEKVFKGEQDKGTIPKDIKAPSRYQIERYLKDNPKVNRDFKRVGRFWIKQT
jgi:hypothetical protein